jgi:hypothetical protein
LFFAFWLLIAAGCSKSEVQVMSPPSSQPPQPIPPTISAQNLKADPKTVSPADRLVEIDRLLAAPLTGRPEESDQRVLLRAEREALVTSGQVAAQRAPRSSAILSQNPPSNNGGTTVVSANGDVINYAPPPPQNNRIIGAPNSQASDLPFLEQMTPTEREHYFKYLRLENRGRVQVDVFHH